MCECAGAAITFPQTGWLEQFPLSQFWRLEVLNQGVGKPVLPLKAPTEDLPHLLRLLVAPGIPWRVAAAAFAWPVSSPVLHVSLIRTLVLALRALSKTPEMSSPRDIPSSVTPAKILSPNTDMTAQVPGIPTWTCVFPGVGWGGTVTPLQRAMPPLQGGGGGAEQVEMEGCPRLLLAGESLLFEEPSSWGAGSIPAGPVGLERWGPGERWGQEKTC